MKVCNYDLRLRSQIQHTFTVREVTMEGIEKLGISLQKIIGKVFSHKLFKRQDYI